MQGYLNKGKEILKILVNNGYEAYFFGETVRNSLMGIDCDEVQILTNASGAELCQIFRSEEQRIINNVYTRINVDGYNIFFNTYSDNYSQSSYTVDVKKVSNRLLDNLSREVFTINSLAMSMSGKIIDSYGGIKDLKKKVIKTVDSAKQCFYEEPIKILGALVILSEHNFSLSGQAESGIKKRIKLLENLDKAEIGHEMKRIVNGRFGRKALTYFIKFGINKVLPFFDKPLKKFISNGKELKYDDFLACCFIMNEEIDEDYLKTADDPNVVLSIYNLGIANEKSEFDDLSLFMYGKELCLKTLMINRVLGRTKKNLEKKILKKYEALPLKKKCDVAFKGEDIMRISDLRDANKIGDLFEDIVYQVLSGALPNDYNKLQDFACEKLKEMRIPYDVTRTIIKGTGNPDRIRKDANELDDYSKFISKVNNSGGGVNTSYWTEGVDEKKDPSFFDLPEPKVRNVSGIAIQEDNIDYSNYKDPEIPNFDQLEQKDEKPKIKDDEFSFASEFDENDENDDSEVQYFYEKIERNELNRKSSNIFDKRILAITNRVVDSVMDNLNEDKEIASLINKADFASKVAEFVNDYLDENLQQ